MDSFGKKRPRKTKLVCRQVVELDEELQKLINATQDITSNETDEVYDKVIDESDLKDLKPVIPPQHDNEDVPNRDKVKRRRKINRIKKKVIPNIPKKKNKSVRKVVNIKESEGDTNLAKVTEEKDIKNDKELNFGDTAFQYNITVKPEHKFSPDFEDESPPDFDEEELERDKEWCADLEDNISKDEPPYVLEKDKEWSADFEENMLKDEVVDEITVDENLEAISAELVTTKLNKLKAINDEEKVDNSMQFSVNIEVEEFDYENELEKIDDDDFFIETSNLNEVCPRNDLFEHPYTIQDHDYGKSLELLTQSDINQIIHGDVEIKPAQDDQTNNNQAKQVDCIIDSEKNTKSEPSNDVVNSDILETTKDNLWKHVQEMTKYVGPVHHAIQLHIKNYFGKLISHVFERSELEKQLSNVFESYKTVNRGAYMLTHPKTYRRIYCYKCYICRNSWYHLHDFQMHMRSHKENYKIDIELEHLCGNIVAFIGTQPVKEQIPIASKCPLCAKSFEDHETYSCFGCFETFQTCLKLRWHEGVCEKFKMVYKQKYGEDARYVNCLICHLSYFSVDEFKSHFKVKHVPRSDFVMPDINLKECFECNNHVPCLKSHECASQPLYHVCAHCDRKFNNCEMVILHESNAIQVNCDFCGFKIKKSCQAADHMLEHTYKYVRVYRCVLCIETLLFFKNISDFKTHKDSMHPFCKPPQFAHQMMILPAKCFEVSETESIDQFQIDEEAKLLEEQILLCSTATVEPPQDLDLLQKPKDKPNILSKKPKSNKRPKEKVVNNDNIPEQNGISEKIQNEEDVGEKKKRSGNKRACNEKEESEPATEVENALEKSHNEAVEETTVEIVEIKPEPLEYDEEMCGSIYNMSFYTEEMTESKNKYVDIENKIVLNTFLRKVYNCSKCDYVGTHKEYKLHVAGRCRLKPTIDPLQPGILKESVIFRCTKCYEENATLKGYIRHLKDHGFSNYQCPECRVSLKCNTTLANHLVSHIRDMFQRIVYLSAEQVRQNYSFRCKICKLQLMDRDFFEHWESHLPLTVLKQEYDDGYGDMDPITLLLQDANMSGIFEVQTETSEPIDVKPALDFLNSGFDTESMDPKPVDLSTAGVNETNPMLTNISENNMVALIRYLLREKRSKKLTKACALCHKEFTRLLDAKRHTIEHLLVQAFAHKPFNHGLKCQICGVLLDKPDHFKQHLREHAKLPIYRCELCNRSFSDSSNFSKHKKIHNFRFLICDHCGRKFQSKKCMITHLESHLNENLLICKHCNQTFSLQSRLTKHIKRVHLRIKFTWSCPICKLRFNSVREKLDHMWIEHKERTQIADCPVCGEMYRKVTDVNKHIREKHQEVWRF